MTSRTACDPRAAARTSCRTLFLFEALDDEQLAWLSEHGRVETRRRRGSVVYRRGRAGDLLLRAARGHDRAGRAGPGRRRRGQPHRPARRLRRAPPQALRAGRPRPSRTYPGSMRAITDCRVLACCRPTSSAPPIRELVPDGRAPARGPLLRACGPERHRRPARAAARPRPALRRAHPRAQQPGRRGRAGDRRRCASGWPAMRHKLATLADGQLDPETLVRLDRRCRRRRSSGPRRRRS